MAIAMGRAKVLCSASELVLVKASTRQEIGGHTAARLRQKETRARKLRDKWRDLSKSQQRASQSKGGNDENKRTSEKAALFDEVLSIFTAQLAKLEAVGETPGPLGKRRSTKSTRSRTHRSARSEVRAELAEAKREIKATSKKVAAPSAVAAPPVKKSKPTATAATPKSKAAAKPGATTVAPVAKPKSKSKRPNPVVKAHAATIEAAEKAQGLRITKQSQLAARTAAKRDRLKASGLIRIQKNRSGANKRNQGRRDSR